MKRWKTGMKYVSMFLVSSSWYYKLKKFCFLLLQNISGTGLVHKFAKLGPNESPYNQMTKGPDKEEAEEKKKNGSKWVSSHLVELGLVSSGF